MKLLVLFPLLLSSSLMLADPDVKKVISVQQAEIQLLRQQISQLNDAIKNENLEQSTRYTSPLQQIQAQATWTALNPKVGWLFAVARENRNSLSCTELCQSLSDSQAGGLKCFNSLHIYANNAFEFPHTTGLKTFKYNGCGGGWGANYCCCSN